MKNVLKKIGLFTTVAAMCTGIGVSAAACNDDDTILIGVGLYEASGPATTAVKSYLEGIGETLNVEFAYTTLSTTDEAANKTAAQNLISMGCQGLILTMDSSTETILEECANAGVYLAGYLCDYEASYETVKNNEYFLGTAVDGAYNGTAWGEHIAERVIAEGYKNIGMIRFPDFAYPHQIEMDTAFREAIDEYNATAAGADKITVQEETSILMFSPLESAYFEANPDLDAIYAMCAGINFVYPTMVSAGKTDIKLYTAGFVTDESTLSNFGTSGTGCIQELVYSNVEAITYPLVMLINKITGNEFADNPTEAQRVDTSQIFITTDEELETVKSKSIYYTGEFEDAFLDGEDVKALLAENGGTHAQLVEAVQSMTMQDLEAL